jgi:hypothetical protein
MIHNEMEYTMKTGPDSDPQKTMSDNEQEWNISRRALLRQASLAGLMLAIPWRKSLFALPQPIPKPYVIQFKPNKTGDGVIGPYGEARVFSMNGETLPVLVSTIDGSAVMDMSVRSPFIRYGGSVPITLTTQGIQFGDTKPVAWSADSIKKMMALFAKDRKQARSVLMLRSALHTAYPVAASQSKSATGKGRSAGAAMSKGAAGYGSRAMTCTTRTITDTATRTITETVEVIKTAEKQYQECFDREVGKDPCKVFGPGAGVCAAAICAAKSFVDMVIGWVDVVTTVTEEVTREVVTCITPRRGDWPNPWTVFESPVQGAVPQPSLAIGTKELEGALKLIKDIGSFLGPFGTCLVNGKWSLAQLTTPIDFGDGNIALPYGVKVCISADCASRLSADGLISELGTSWGAALAALAALSPEFAASVSSLGITAAPAVVAIVAAVPPAIVSAAALILAFIILALIYGTAISGQLFFQKTFTDNFADGIVCIEHATFALALIKLATFGIAPAELIPPIVTG